MVRCRRYVRIDSVEFTILLPLLKNQEALQFLNPAAYTEKREPLKFPRRKVETRKNDQMKIYLLLKPRLQTSPKSYPKQRHP